MVNESCMTEATNNNLNYHQNFDLKDIWVDLFPNAMNKIKVTPNRSNFYFLIFSTSSDNTIVVDGQVYELEKNDVVLLTPYTSKRAELGTIKDAIGLAFTDSFYTVSPVHKQFFFDTLASTNSPIYFAIQDLHSENEFVGSMFQQLYDIFHTQNEELIKWRIIRTLTSVIFLYIQKRTATSVNALPKHENPTSKNIVFDYTKLINEHYLTENQIGFYASELGITTEELYRKCKEVLQLSPKEIIQNKVLGEAKRLLKNEEYSVQQIAYHLGFSDDSSFIKFFQKRMKMTPRRFRIQNI